jgi:hypothetical protein
VARAGGNVQHAVQLRRQVAATPAQLHRIEDIPRGLGALLERTWERIAHDAVVVEGLGISIESRSCSNSWRDAGMPTSLDLVCLPLQENAMQRTLTINYGDDLLAGLGLSPEQFQKEIRFLAAAKLYEMGRITSGQAARFCDMDRVEFLLSLPRIGMTVSNMRPDDAEAELDFAHHG